MDNNVEILNALIIIERVIVIIYMKMIRIQLQFVNGVVINVLKQQQLIYQIFQNMIVFKIQI